MIKLLQLFLPYLFTLFLSPQTTNRQKLILDPNLKKNKNASPNSAHHYAGKEKKKFTTAGLWVEGREENPPCFSKLLIYQLKKHLRTSPPGEKYIHVSVVLLITPNSFLKCAHSCMLGEASEVGGGDIYKYTRGREGRFELERARGEALAL